MLCIRYGENGPVYGSDGGGGSDAPRVRNPRSESDRREHHAADHQREHQRADDNDRRERRRYDIQLLDGRGREKEEKEERLFERHRE